MVTVAEVLERKGQLESVGGSAYLTSLINLTPTAVNAAYYARIVERKAILRNLISAAGRIAGIGYDESADVYEAIDRAESELFAVSQRRVQVRVQPAAPAPAQPRTTGSTTCTSTRARSAASAPGSRTSTRSPRGFRSSDLVIVAARPSIGKTSLALNFAEHAAVREGGRSASSASR